MSLFLLANKKKNINPKQKFGSSLEFWMNPKFSQKTFNGNYVSQINDLSGNNRHAVQATALKQPLYVPNNYAGLPSLHFDSTNQQNLSWSNFTVGGIKTFVICLQKPLDSSNGFIFSRISWNTYGMQLYLNNTSMMVQYCKSGSSAGNSVSVAVPSSSVQLAVVVDNVNLKIKFYLNGQKIGTDQNMSWAFAESTGNASVITGGGVSYALTGDIYNYYIVNREMTPAEIMQDHYDWTKYRI